MRQTRQPKTIRKLDDLMVVERGTAPPAGPFSDFLKTLAAALVEADAAIEANKREQAEGGQSE